MNQALIYMQEAAAHANNRMRTRPGLRIEMQIQTVGIKIVFMDREGAKLLRLVPWDEIERSYLNILTMSIDSSLEVFYGDRQG